MQFDVRKLCWLWLLIAPAAAHAQLWSGPSAVEVRAEDDHGHALAGAHVLLQYTSLKPKDGPPVVGLQVLSYRLVPGLIDKSLQGSVGVASTSVVGPPNSVS